MRYDEIEGWKMQDREVRPNIFKGYKYIFNNSDCNIMV